jgi:hypothetical protein
MLDPEEKTVLVHFNERVRPVKFNGGKDDLAASVCAAFADVFEVQSTSILLQIKDEEWEGEFVDLLDQPIPHKSRIKAISILSDVRITGGSINSLSGIPLITQASGNCDNSELPFQQVQRLKIIFDIICRDI